MVGGIWAKHRVKIISSYQHPYSHALSDFLYANGSLPGVTNVEAALNYLVAVLYPQTKPQVNTFADLPLVGNTLNDFRVVSDDGDGKAAGYRWEKREGEVSPSWHKIYDMDWGSDSILQQFLAKTQDIYVKNSGNDDLDASGSPITGLYAGQTIYGGTSANTNLTLRANSGDATGATGYVQTDDNFRPSIDGQFTSGLLNFQWANVYSEIFTAGTLAISPGSITDSSGLLDFDATDLKTTGDITGAIVKAKTSLVAEVSTNTITITPGSLVDTTGNISFGSSNLLSTGTLSTNTHTITNGTDTLVINPNNGSKATIISSLGSISFSGANLATTGTASTGELTATKINVDNISLDGDTITKTGVGNLTITSSNNIILSQQANTQGIAATGAISATTTISSGSIRLTDTSVLLGLTVDADITITPNGTGKVVLSSNLLPAADNSKNLGSTSSRFGTLYLGTGLHDGSTSVGIDTLISLRSINTGVTSGMSLFYDGTKWVSSLPDTEIAHNTLSGLTTTDAGHTQFVMLAGRAGGQTIQGGTAASNNLTLESTSHATKGFIYFSDDFLPSVNASYSTGWSGKNLGSTSYYLNNIYTKGESIGFRLENLATDPASSAQNPGRLFYNTTDKKIRLDIGTAIKNVGSNTYAADTSWNGTDKTKTVTVSASVDDARKCIWQLRDLSTNSYEIIYAKITTSQTQVTIEVNIALPAGNYKLIGCEAA